MVRTGYFDHTHRIATAVSLFRDCAEATKTALRAGSHKIGRRRSGELRDTQRAQVAADSGEHDATPRRRDQVRVLKRPGL